jgi:hypothetical protein
MRAENVRQLKTQKQRKIMEVALELVQHATFKNGNISATNLPRHHRLERSCAGIYQAENQSIIRFKKLG